MLEEESSSPLDRVEWLLIGIAATLVLVGVIFLASSPAWWGWYLQMLMPSYWSWRMWVIVSAILIEVLFVVRFWAKNRKPPVEEDPGRIEEILKRVAGNSILLIAVVVCRRFHDSVVEVGVFPMVLDSHLLVLDEYLVGEAEPASRSSWLSAVVVGGSRLSAAIVAQE